MATYEIELGTSEHLAVLYSYPNVKNDRTSLAETIEHWVGLTLEHDGLTEATWEVVNDRDIYTLRLSGPTKYNDEFRALAARLPKFLEHGWTAYTYDVTRIKEGCAIKPWDPVIKDWRFFLTHGLTLARPKCVQFFHYPPIRLLALRNYLKDPVPHRCEEMLVANGVPSMAEARRYEAVMDACPIGASDEQGQMGTIPIDEFYSYQSAQTRLLVSDPKNSQSGWKKNFTIPIVVFGQHPKRVFSHLFLGERDRIQGLGDRKHPNGTLQSNTVCLVKNIIPGKQTPVIGSTHPYAFYGISQVGPRNSKNKGEVGQGYIHTDYVKSGSDDVARRMIQDLVIAGWQVELAANPKKDPFKVMKSKSDYWSDKAQWPTVCSYVLHQGSLWYPVFAKHGIPTPDDPDSLEFTWNLSLDEAAAMGKKHKYDLPSCIQALRDLAKKKSAPKKAKKAKAAKKAKKKRA